MDHEQLIERYFAAMRRGAEAEEEMLALFTDDVIYSDPFDPSGPPEAIVGLTALAERLRSGWEFNPPDLELSVLSVTVEGHKASSTWECRSEVFDQPMTGRDEYTFRDGKIAELHVRMTGDGPPAPPE